MNGTSPRGSGNAKNQAGRRWIRLALLAVLIVLGHDALMAGRAYAGQPPVGHDAGGHRVPAPGPVGGSPNAVVATDDESPLPHPMACATGRAVARGLDDDIGDGDGAVTDSLVAALPVVLGSPGSRWTEPTAPPGVRRALLQVYLI